MLFFAWAVLDGILMGEVFTESYVFESEITGFV